MANIDLTSTTASGYLQTDFELIKDLVQDGGTTAVTFDTAILNIDGERLILNTGALTLTPSAADSSVLTIGAGAVSVSGSNTGDNTVCTSGTATTAATLATGRTIGGVSFNGSANITVASATGAFAVTGALTVTNDNSSADTGYVGMVLYNTDASPPAASGFPVGTIYVQYTA